MEQTEKFVRIPHSFLENHLSKIGLTNFAVYVTLLKFADFQTGACHPKIETVASLAGLSRSTVKRSLTNLSKIGLVTKISGVATGKNNRYFVHREQVGGSPMDQGWVTSDPGGGSPVDHPNKEELEPLNKNHRTKPLRTAEQQLILPKNFFQIHPPKEDLGVRYSQAAFAQLWETGFMTEDLVPKADARTYVGFWVEA